MFGNTSAQIDPIDTIYRTSDTIYIKITEKIEVDTSFDYGSDNKHSKILSIDYTITTLKNHDFLINEILSNLKAGKERYPVKEEFHNGSIWDIPFKSFSVFKQNGYFRLFVNLKNQKKQGDFYCGLKEVINKTSLELTGVDTLNFYSDPFETHNLDYDNKGDLVRTPILDSLLVEYNMKENQHNIHGFRLRDNYLQLQDIYTNSTMPIGKFESSYFKITNAGEIQNCYYKTENKDSNYFVAANIFKSIRYPVLKINGACQPYIISSDKDNFTIPLYNRFIKDFEQKRNIYPIFEWKDSLFLYQSEVDNQYFLYSNNHYYKDRTEYLVSFPDTLSINSMFYDFNNDGITDFVFPVSSALFSVLQKVIYGGGPKDKTGLPSPRNFYNMKYSDDSNYFTSYERQWDFNYRQTTLYMFAHKGDSVLMQCTFYMPYTALWDNDNFEKYVIKIKNKPYGKVYYFVDNLDKNIDQPKFYIMKLSKAKRKYKKTRRLIYYYRDHPDKIPK